MTSEFDKVIGVFAGLAGAAGVAALAAGAHAYPGLSVDTAGQVLLMQAAALLALANPTAGPSRLRRFSAFAMVGGMVLFSGDLIIRAIGGNHVFPMATPVGGLILIAAWLIAALSFATRK